MGNASLDLHNAPALPGFAYHHLRLTSREAVTHLREPTPRSPPGGLVGAAEHAAEQPFVTRLAIAEWKVKELLEAHDVTPYRFWKESGLANRTAYRLVNGETTTVNTDTLDATIRTLRTLTGRQVEIADLLEYQEGEG